MGFLGGENKPIHYFHISVVFVVLLIASKDLCEKNFVGAHISGQAKNIVLILSLKRVNSIFKYCFKASLQIKETIPTHYCIFMPRLRGLFGMSRSVRSLHDAAAQPRL